MEVRATLCLKMRCRVSRSEIGGWPILCVICKGWAIRAPDSVRFFATRHRLILPFPPSAKHSFDSCRSTATAATRATAGDDTAASQELQMIVTVVALEPLRHPSSVGGRVASDMAAKPRQNRERFGFGKSHPLQRGKGWATRL